MEQLKEGIKVYCDLHHKSKTYTIESLAKKESGWAIVKDEGGNEFYWPITSCFPVETTTLPKYSPIIHRLYG